MPAKQQLVNNKNNKLEKTKKQKPPLRTRLGEILRPLNSEYGKVVPGWGTTPIMGFVMIAFLVFLLIILQIYNSSLIIENVDVDWTSLLT
jgi:photosystem II PsbH protein